MKETSDEVAAIAGRGLTKPLNRTDQKKVCASVLAQHEIIASLAAIKRRAARIKRRFPDVAADLDRLLADLHPVR